MNVYRGLKIPYSRAKKNSDPFDQVYLRNTNPKTYYRTKEANEIREKETKSDYIFILQLLINLKL